MLPSMALDTIDSYTSVAQTKRLYSAHAVGAQLDDVAEVQSLVRSGTPTGGTFTLSYGGTSGTAIDYDGDAYEVQAGLRNIFAIRNIEVTRHTGTSPNFTDWVRFVDITDDASILVLATNGLTGGSTPTVTIATLQAGDDTALDDAIIMACEEINKYAYKHYSPARLGQSNLVNQWATWLACYYLSGRKGNDPPKVFAREFERIEKQLMMVLTGMLDIPNIPKRRASAMSWSNIVLNPQYDWRVIRKDKGTSSPQPTSKSVIPSYEEQYSVEL
jgi:hypothetical protein